jgi:hypothetical protein
VTPETNAERTLAVDIGLPHLPSAPGVLGIEQVTGKRVSLACSPGHWPDRVNICAPSPHGPGRCFGGPMRVPGPRYRQHRPLCSVMASSLPDRPIRHPKSNRSGSALTGTQHTGVTESDEHCCGVLSSEGQ